MNRTPPGFKLSQAFAGFLQAKSAEGRSPRTIESYRHHLAEWREHAGDVLVRKITSRDLTAYLAYLREGYKPRRLSGKNDEPLSPKTIRNVWITFSSFFRWLNREFEIPNPVKSVPAPKFTEAVIEPFTQQEVAALLKAAEYCREAETDSRRAFTMRRGTGLPDRAIVLTLLDTGLRASEICAVNISDVDEKTGKVQIKHGARGGAKGGYGRTVYLGKTSRQAVWRYLMMREDVADANAPLFVARGRRMTRDTLRQLTASLGEKAKVNKCHPHRFRHTFAITYLRSGGDVFTLQQLLGHHSLDMVQHYARVAQIDLEQAHQRASPVDNWHL